MDRIIRDEKFDILMRDLQERAKELNCLYQIEELLGSTDIPIEGLFYKILEVVPCGWQFPEICRAKIVYENQVYKFSEFEESIWSQSAEIKIQDKVAGTISVFYLQEVPRSDHGPFLKEETKLINTIAERIGHTVLYKRLRKLFHEMDKDKDQMQEWERIAQLLRSMDQKLYLYISQKMIHYLALNGIKDAEALLQQFNINRTSGVQAFGESNQPSQKQPMTDILKLSSEVFRIASENLSGDRIISLIQKWIREDKSRFWIKAINQPSSSLSDIIEAVTRYSYMESEGFRFSAPIEKGIQVSLIRRFFSDHLKFINIASQFIEVRDFSDLAQHIVYPAKSHGHLGGKSAGLFLASKIARKANQYSELFDNLRVPKSWYITSDGLMSFIDYNNLEDVLEQKYKNINEIQLDYPHIVQIFKNSHFPPEMVKGLSLAIDDMGDSPIIVRSSSLLEDRLGSTFSGKYKSLFLANQGKKEEKLAALMDAIAEVYASTFGPDPIEYRMERELLDFNEEMGIIIQQVVGNKIDKYFFPSFAGVAFSSNEFRWSPRISREDGLIRMVPGLGTRAVDRTSDDYPVLVSPGQPDMRLNLSQEDMIRYSIRNLDVINLETNRFETIEISSLLKKYGDRIPGIEQMVSIEKEDCMEVPSSIFRIHFQKDSLIVNFEGLFRRGKFVKQIGALLKLIQEKMENPVDIEFAHDGQYLYLLQCRPQCYSSELLPSPIPDNIPSQKILFSANQNISNGLVPDITHVVYVDPESYNNLSDLEHLKSVGKAVGKLNQLLPKRQFILMGPGRWGSRGDIKLGVNVTYSDISRTAMLIEIARKKGNYVPELSFGTHFFQDLVESSIRYLPLYPDTENVIFQEAFFKASPNILGKILPEYAFLSDTIHVIDISTITNGMILRILMNGDLNRAVAFFSDPALKPQNYVEKAENIERHGDDFWRWRSYIAEKIAGSLDGSRFGVKGLYIFGSSKNASAGPCSDIDLLVHFIGTEEQKEKLMLWLEGWGLSLADRNYLRTGCKNENLLDVYFVSDEDIANQIGYAVKINAVTDAARRLPLKNEKS